MRSSDGDKAAIAGRIRQIIAERDAPEGLKAGMLYALDGGKFLRPRLLLSTAEELGRRDAVTLDFAAALEMLHTASLLHDDLPCIDNDRLRRGRESNWAHFGEAAAVLHGDALQNLGFTVMLDAVKDPATLAACRLISNCAGDSGMLGGQFLDVSNTQVAVGAELVAEIARRKTAMLFVAAIAGGALLAGVAADEALMMDAGRLGLAFQIADDLIDAGCGTQEAGKTLGKDSASGKNTFVSVLGEAESKHYIKALMDGANAKGLKTLADFCKHIGESITQTHRRVN